MRKPKRGDVLRLLSLSGRTNLTNDFSISEFIVLHAHKHDLDENMYYMDLVSIDLKTNFSEEFGTKGFDDNGIELGRTNTLFVLNPTPNTIELAKKLIFGKCACKENLVRRHHFRKENSDS